MDASKVFNDILVNLRYYPAFTGMTEEIVKDAIQDNRYICREWNRITTDQKSGNA